MKEHRWIISVLDDLEQYAQKNDLGFLLQELTKTKAIAKAEIEAEAAARLAGAQSV